MIQDNIWCLERGKGRQIDQGIWLLSGFLRVGELIHQCGILYRTKEDPERGQRYKERGGEVLLDEKIPRKLPEPWSKL
jgi:hypothetical protein